MYNPQLDTFRIVAELGSFSKASKKLYVTTSAILQQINSLEEHLEVKLFIRTNQGLKLTPAGEYLYSALPRLISWNQELKKQLRILDSGEQRPLRVGIPKIHRMRFFYEFWTNYSAQHPDQAVELYEAANSSYEEINKTYRHADIVEFPLIGADWQKDKEFIEICKCPIVIGVPPRHPLASRSQLSFTDLADYDVVIHNQPFLDLFGDHWPKLKEIVPQIEILPVYTNSTIANCIMKNRLIFLLQCSASVYHDLKIIPLDWDFAVPYGFFYTKKPDYVVESFLAYAKEQIQSEALYTAW